MLRRKRDSGSSETEVESNNIHNHTQKKKLQNSAVIAELWSPGLSHISGLLISKPDFVFGNRILITLVFLKFSNNFIKRKVDAHVECIHILCLRNLAAIAITIEDALKLSFGGKLTIFTSHQVKQLLNGKGHLWISDQRILSYQVMMMEYPGLTISPCEVLNPATLLPTSEGSLPFQSCLETLDKTWRGIVTRSSDQSWGNLVH